MNKKIFTFKTSTGDMPTDAGVLRKVVGDLNRNESKSDILIPRSGDGSYIDIVNDFKWTKTTRNSEGRKNTPTVRLEEFYVTVPSFFSNLNVVQQMLQTAGGGVVDALKSVTAGSGIGESITTAIGEAGQALGDEVDRLMEEGRNAFGADADVVMPNHLKAYENLYGVKRTRFKYKLPYLGNSYKSISNNWGANNDLSKLAGGGLDALTNVFGMLSPGVGIDYSKTFSYGEQGPEHTISFYLDNTKDGEYSGRSDVEVKERSLEPNFDLNVGLSAPTVPNYETNFRFVYLLLYQSLPNRINKITFVPPVIYSAILPGVFSYRWAYMKNIEVNMVGVRKTKTINDFINKAPSDVVIPEGYEIKITLQSLVPETQNLYYDAFNNAVTVSQASGPIV